MKTPPTRPDVTGVDKFASKWQTTDGKWWRKGVGGQKEEAEPPKARVAAKATPPPGEKKAMPTRPPAKTPKMTVEDVTEGYRKAMSGEPTDQNVHDAAGLLAKMTVDDVKKITNALGYGTLGLKAKANKGDRVAALAAKLAEDALKAVGVKAPADAASPAESPPPPAPAPRERRLDDDAPPPPPGPKTDVPGLTPGDADTLADTLEKDTSPQTAALWDAAPPSLRPALHAALFRLEEERAIRLVGNTDSRGAGHGIPPEERAKMPHEGHAFFTSLAVHDPAKVREVLKGLASGVASKAAPDAKAPAAGKGGPLHDALRKHAGDASIDLDDLRRTSGMSPRAFDHAVLEAQDRGLVDLSGDAGGHHQGGVREGGNVYSHAMITGAGHASLKGGAGERRVPAKPPTPAPPKPAPPPASHPTPAHAHVAKLRSGGTLSPQEVDELEAHLPGGAKAGPPPKKAMPSATPKRAAKAPTTPASPPSAAALAAKDDYERSAFMHPDDFAAAEARVEALGNNDVIGAAHAQGVKFAPSTPTAKLRGMLLARMRDRRGARARASMVDREAATYEPKGA